MKVINIIGGPSTGKSTCAAELYAKMKKEHMNVELITEYAKQLIYDDRLNIIENDQLYILAKQNRKLKMLEHKIDYVITDSPIMLSSVYYRLNGGCGNTFTDLVKMIYQNYNNIMIDLIRNDYIPFQQEGRIQNKTYASIIDTQIRNILKEENIEIDYTTLVDDKVVDRIFNVIIEAENV